MNHLDMEQLNELKEVLEDEFQVLINTYLIDAQLRLKLIEEGLDTNNYEQVRLAAHSLKGASANIGALILAQLCEQLEHDCKLQKYSDLDTLVISVSEELSIINKELLIT
ncbi:MAG TPA: Hpt domain-containing protein [Agitococcus sp.]|nr:Hpt domain-containing protein [Agitococcus sp.]